MLFLFWRVVWLLLFSLCLPFDAICVHCMYFGASFSRIFNLCAYYVSENWYWKLTPFKEACLETDPLMLLDSHNFFQISALKNLTFNSNNQNCVKFFFAHWMLVSFIKNDNHHSEFKRESMSQ